MRHLLLALTLTLAAPALADELAARKSADFFLTLSDADYADVVKEARADGKNGQWAGKGRTELVATLYRGIAASKRRSAQPTKAGRETDAVAASPDASLLTDTGWWDSVNAYLEQPRPQYRGYTAVAAVRGGRKLSTADDKAVAKALAAADAADKAGRPLDAASAYEAAATALEKPAGAEPAAKAAVPAAAASYSPQEIYKRDAPSVVLIIGSNGGGQGELGTGSIVAGGRILTNAHVVISDHTGRPFTTLRVYLKPAKVTGDPKRDMTDPIAATVVKYDRALDLASLELARKPKAAALELGDDGAVEPGEPVVAIGHPEQGGLWTLTQGVVSTVIADLGGVPGKDAFQTDASINRGNSGGPLLDRGGRIVGVNTSMARKAADGLTITSVNFSVRASVARRFLDLSPAVSVPPAAEAPAVAEAGPESEAAPAAAPKAEPKPEPEAAPAAPEPKAAPAKAAELPPPPKTQPVILTPVKPYKEADAIAEGIKEMEDLESEMRGEIEKRR
jgi:serine protease Do